MKKTFNFLIYVNALAIVYLLLNYIINPDVSLDSGYYLQNAKEFFSGKIYFKEIGIAYNPLSIITFGLPFLFDELPNYRWHLFINLIIILSSALLFYNILKSNTKYKTKQELLLFTSLFLLLSLIFDGKYLMLEPLSVFFQLLALYHYLSFKKNQVYKNIFFTGIFISLSFLSKQYGLFLLVPIFLDIIFSKNNKLKISLIGIIGLLLPLTIFFIYLRVGFVDFIKFILGKGVNLDIGTGTAINATFTSHLVEISYFVAFNLYILLFPVLIFREKNKRQIAVFLLLFVVSLSVLSFATYFHYFLYVIPYSLLLIAMLYNRIEHKKLLKASSVLLILSNLFIYMYLGLVVRDDINGKAKNKELRQNKIVGVFLSNIPTKSKVYLDGPPPSLYYLCNYKSINLEKIGFSFPGYFYPKTIVNFMDEGAYLVINKDEKNQYSKSIKEMSSEKEISVNGKNYIVFQK